MMMRSRRRKESLAGRLAGESPVEPGALPYRSRRRGVARHGHWGVGGCEP